MAETLHTTTGTWTGEPSAFRYQWLREYRLWRWNLYWPIRGANSADYTPTRRDQGHRIASSVSTPRRDGRLWRSRLRAVRAMSHNRAYH